MKEEDTILHLMNFLPGIEKSWKEHLEYWGNEERGSYNDIEVLVGYVVDQYKVGNTGFLPRFFNEIAKLLKKYEK